MISLETALVGGLLVALGLVVAVALHRRNVPATVNAAGSIAVTILSIVLATGLEWPWHGPALAPALPLWIGSAGLLHSIGMLGPYDSVWWWDHLTHMVSAALVAALIYAGLLVVAPSSPILPDGGSALASLVVGCTGTIGVFWELVELLGRELGRRYDIEPVLVHYGWRDTALDLVADLAAALFVVIADLRLFVELAAISPETTRSLLAWTLGTVGAGSVVIGLGFAWRSWRGTNRDAAKRR